MQSEYHVITDDILYSSELIKGIKLQLSGRSKITSYSLMYRTSYLTSTTPQCSLDNLYPHSMHMAHVISTTMVTLSHNKAHSVNHMFRPSGDLFRPYNSCLWNTGCLMLGGFQWWHHYIVGHWWWPHHDNLSCWQWNSRWRSTTLSLNCRASPYSRESNHSG